MKLLSKSVILAIFAFTTFTLQGQNDGFIYGKLTTIDGDTYTGQMRWGKEEAYWGDIFNGTKEENENYRYLSRSERNDLRDDRRRGRRWSGFNISWGNDYETTHEFQVRFGDLSKIEIRRRSEVEVTLRNGDQFYVKDGSNDIGAEITIMDDEMGKMKFRWSRVETVEFMDTPKSLDNTLGEPLYGTVEYYGGKVTGVIQWDHDERLSTDKLDGDTRDGDMSIDFGRLRSIERERSGSNIVTKSGRELYLRGSNDVNSENRGIIVNTEFGRVDIPWREFKMVTFEDNPGVALKSYSAFSNVSKVNATVKTADGQTLTGRIIYDLDEEYNFEMVQGKDDDVEYIIPLESIKTIIPKNYDNSKITLKNGQELILGESRDVSEDNDGVLVFTGSGDPTYVRWEDVKEITFN